MAAKKVLVFDIEADGLLPEVTRIWILSLVNPADGKVRSFSDYDSSLPPLREGLDELNSADEIVGHNILTYDILALEKVLNFKLDRKVKLTDTLIYSQLLNYKRFGFGHSLDAWGEFLGYRKQPHDDWLNYSSELRSRCETDVELNLKVYLHLIKELLTRKQPQKLLISIDAEHAVSKFVGKANLLGWPFNRTKAEDLLFKIEVEIKRIENIVNPQLRLRILPVDQKEDVKSPAFIRNGNYAARTAGWFEIDPELGKDEENRPIWGDYCRVQTVQPDVGSIEAVKARLYEIGWVPSEYNYVKDKKSGNLIRTSPKLTDDSLEPLGEFGAAITEYYTLRARQSILTGWLDKLDGNNRLHGDCFVIGTPTRRSAHKIIANIPAEGKAAFGAEFRGLFEASPGWTIVGTDSKGNQLRGLAHLIGNDKFTETILTGDIHTENMKIIEKILGHEMPGNPDNPELSLKKRRDRAKKFNLDFYKFCEFGEPPYYAGTIPSEA